MCATIRHCFTEAVVTYEEQPREQWIFDPPAQVRREGEREREKEGGGGGEQLLDGNRLQSSIRKYAPTVIRIKLMNYQCPKLSHAGSLLSTAYTYTDICTDTTCTI